MDPQVSRIIIVALVFGAIAISMLGMAWASRPRRAPGRGASTDSDERLMRMENAIDAIAIEVERIAEAQRFTAKLMSDRLAALPDQRSGAGVITPH
ncbi:MAG TPA: hypothetical protein VMM18_05090 [Gemmatimonadaceae bacterium]|nr:hypothetical protein [Gemmatimonadaceae bacterium]